MGERRDWEKKERDGADVWGLICNGNTGHGLNDILISSATKLDRQTNMANLLSTQKNMLARDSLYFQIN